MAEPRQVFLEVDGAALPAMPLPDAPREAPWLEPADSAPEPQAPTRRKVRALDRGASVDNEVSIAILAALPTDRPLMAALWPDVAPGELLRSPPTEATFRARCDFALRAIDAIARRDADARARAEVAQRSLRERLDRLAASGAPPLEVALAELRRTQCAALLADAALLAGGTRTLRAPDVAKLIAAAQLRGIEGNVSLRLVREHGYTVDEGVSHTWTAFEALPGAPASLDAVAQSLFAHPAHGTEAVRSGAVLAWLRANSASADMIERSREAMRTAEHSEREALALHLQAWALGHEALFVSAVTLRSPGEIAPAVRKGTVTLDALVRASRQGTLPAWLRRQGWTAAASAADLVARGEPTGLKRLAWSLGEPLVVGDVGVDDPATLARLIFARPELRTPLEALYATGDLLAWLESLPAVLRNDGWADRVRRAAGDTLPLWEGLYTIARHGTLTLRARDGDMSTFTSVDPLRVTTQLAASWDALKRTLHSGELLAWLTVVAPEVELPSLPRPPRDEECELNRVLWALGHAGLVLEWGSDDLAITSLGDIVRAWQRSWQHLEAHVTRGHVIEWIERFHGTQTLITSAHGERAIQLRDALHWLRAEVGRLPVGHLALKLALLCGLRYLPIDPTAPGDAATYRGYEGVTGPPASVPRAWSPLHEHVAAGSAVLWLALSPAEHPLLARSMMQSAFPGVGNTRHAADRLHVVVSALERTFGSPVPSARLASEMRGPADPLSSDETPTAAPRRSHAGAAARWLFVAGLCVAAYATYRWWLTHANTDVPAPMDASRAAPLVQMRVRVQGDRLRNGAPWDYDGSAPEFRVLLMLPGEIVDLGTCVSGHRCELGTKPLRLGISTPFRVAVDEMDWMLSERIGTAWLSWSGGREEILHARVGAAELRVSVRHAMVPVAPSTQRAVDAGIVHFDAAVDAVPPRRVRTRIRREGAP